MLPDHASAKQPFALRVRPRTLAHPKRRAREAGQPQAALAERYLELPVDRVEACLRYSADYRDEIDDWIDRARAIADREKARWQRRGEALA